MLIQVSPFLRAPVTMGGAALGRQFPKSLSNLELYLDSGLGLGSFADGANVTTWPDQSGHSPTRDSVVTGAPQWNPPVMQRVSNLTPKGLPTVQWATPDATTPQGLASSSFTWPATTNGYTIHWYGRVHNKTTPAWQFINQGPFSGDGANNKYTTSVATGGAPNSYGYIDNAGGGNPHRFGTEASIDNAWHLFTWLLPPPDNNTVPMRMFLDGVEVTQVSGPANWQSDTGASAYTLGNVAAGTTSLRAEMGWIAWYSVAQSVSTIALFNTWVNIFWGH